MEAIGEMPQRAGSAADGAGVAGAALAIKNFLAAVDGDDSLFCVAQPLAGPSADETANGRIFFGDIVLAFRDAANARNRSLHFLLMEKMIELLKEAGSQETLEATLCLTSGSIPGDADRRSQKELALWMRLVARGDAPEQAILRWGLGLAHLQQALLFTSRYLRMQLGQTAG